MTTMRWAEVFGELSGKCAAQNAPLDESGPQKDRQLSQRCDKALGSNRVFICTHGSLD